MANICDLNKQPDIEYPTFWEYKIIIDSTQNAENIAAEVAKDREYKLEFSKFSSDKKYKSYNLAVKVSCQNERLEIFNALKSRAKYVL